MILYDESGLAREIRLPRKFEAGCCGRSYLLENGTRFKIYIETTEPLFRLKYPILNFLRELDSPNIIRTYEGFYSEPVEDLNNTLAAYTYKHVEAENINILEMYSKYLIDNFSRLEELINILAQNNIIVKDLKPENTIMNSKNIVLIDPDCFIQDEMSSKRYIITVNKRRLLALMRDLIYHGYCRDYFVRNEDTLFSRNLEEEKNMSKFVSKRLFFCRRVINYMK